VSIFAQHCTLRIMQYPRIILVMIKSIRHKGLKKFHETGSTKGINSDHRQKLGDQLDFLDAATIVDDMDIPGYRLHPFKGKDNGRWSITVSGNWRLTFEFIDGDVYVLNYEDYH
jgi:proteic killer suppression protein